MTYGQGADEVQDNVGTVCLLAGTEITELVSKWHRLEGMETG
jgi:hypothetical protein